MKIDYFIKEYGIYVYMALILVISCFAVNNISYTKGQLDMCESNGMFFTSNKTCITCEESGRISLNNN